MAGILQWLSKMLKSWVMYYSLKWLRFLRWYRAHRFSGNRIAANLNSLQNNIRGDVRYQIIKRTLLEEPPLDNLGGRVARMEDGRGELFSRSCYYFLVVDERDLDEKLMGWLGGVSARLPSRDLDMIMPHKHGGNCQSTTQRFDTISLYSCLRCCGRLVRWVFWLARHQNSSN